MEVHFHDAWPAANEKPAWRAGGPISNMVDGWMDGWMDQFSAQFDS
jgi:hypothetical protein